MATTDANFSGSPSLLAAAVRSGNGATSPNHSVRMTCSAIDATCGGDSRGAPNVTILASTWQADGNMSCDAWPEPVEAEPSRAADPAPAPKASAGFLFRREGAVMPPNFEGAPTGTLHPALSMGCIIAKTYATSRARSFFCNNTAGADCATASIKPQVALQCLQCVAGDTSVRISSNLRTWLA
mmetsp:Transcript_81248/g.263139  ORF Transcript_81248/g.263139 Transcript_81248/m.263139 type:complete len:183 (+) Transcript_81248:1185-1733(+)